MIGPARAILGLTLRSIAGGKRLIALALLNLLPIIGVLIARAADADPARVFGRAYGNLHLPIICALVALSLAGSAVSEERDDGTIVYLTQTPVPRLAIAAAKVAAVWIATLVTVLPSTLAVLLVARDVGAAAVGWAIVGTLLVTFAYAGAFTWLALRMRRAIIAGLAYVAIWEGTIAGFAASAKRLSISAYGRVFGREGDPAFSWASAAPARPLTAVLVLCAIGVLGLWASARRLERMELP